jgi:hypothetical protein
LAYEYRGSLSLSLELSRVNPIPSFLYDLFYPEGLPVKILKVLLLSSILATRFAHHNLLGLITQLYLMNGTNYEVPHGEPFPLSILILLTP